MKLGGRRAANSLIGHEINVAPTAAGPAQRLVVYVCQDGHGAGGVQVTVPRGGVHAEHPGIHRAHGLVGVDADIDKGRRGRGHQPDVGDIKRGLQRAANPDFNRLQIADAGRAEGRQGERELLPGVGGRRDLDLRPPGGTRFGLHANLLPARGAAVQPQRQVGVNRGVNLVVIQFQGLIGAAGNERNGVGAVVTGVVGDIIRHPAPVLPAVVVVQRAINHIGVAGINQHVVVGPHRRGRRHQRDGGQNHRLKAGKIV